MTFPFPSFVTTVNCCVPFTGSVTDVGAMVSDVIGLKSVLLEHAATNSTANALATITRAMRARCARDRATRLMLTLSIGTPPDQMRVKRAGADGVLVRRIFRGADVTLQPPRRQMF
jgi:hypothetical protein